MACAFELSNYYVPCPLAMILWCSGVEDYKCLCIPHDHSILIRYYIIAYVLILTAHSIIYLVCVYSYMSHFILCIQNICQAATHVTNRMLQLVYSKA